MLKQKANLREFEQRSEFPIYLAVMGGLVVFLVCQIQMISAAYHANNFKMKSTYRHLHDDHLGFPTATAATCARRVKERLRNSSGVVRKDH